VHAPEDGRPAALPEHRGYLTVTGTSRAASAPAGLVAHSRVSRMPDFVDQLWRWLHTHQGKKVFRYTMVSAISTGCSFFVLFIVFGVLRLWSEVPSTVFANAVATIPSYWLNRSWAWGKKGRSHLVKEVIPFFSLSAIGIAFSIVGASFARHISLKHDLNHLESTVLVLAANLVSFGIFWILKLKLFNRLFHVESLLEEIDEHIDAEEHSEDASVL
jgi:putative flippase GtrA